MYRASEEVLCHFSEFLVSLVSAHSVFGQLCMETLIGSFTEPAVPGAPPDPDAHVLEPGAVRQRLWTCLADLIRVVPSQGPVLFSTLRLNTPHHKRASTHMQWTFFHSLFEFAKLVPTTMEYILPLAVEHLMALDVDAKDDPECEDDDEEEERDAGASRGSADAADGDGEEADTGRRASAPLSDVPFAMDSEDGGQDSAATHEADLEAALAQDLPAADEHETAGAGVLAPHAEGPAEEDFSLDTATLGDSPREKLDALMHLAFRFFAHVFRDSEVRRGGVHGRGDRMSDKVVGQQGP